jgi:hypothetical protein
MSGMKKFFGIGLLALLTTAYLTSSCSRDEFSGSLLEAKKATFNDNFIAEYGNIAPNHDWGFGSNNGTRAFTRAAADGLPDAPTFSRKPSKPSSSKTFYNTLQEAIDNVGEENVVYPENITDNNDWNSINSKVVRINATYYTVGANSYNMTIIVAETMSFDASGLSNSGDGCIICVPRGVTLTLTGTREKLSIYLASGANLDLSSMSTASITGDLVMAGNNTVTADGLYFLNSKIIANGGCSITATQIELDQNCTLWNEGTIRVKTGDSYTADNALKVKNTGVTIYNAASKTIEVGSIDLNASGTELIYNDGIVTCHGAIELDNSSDEIVNNGSLSGASLQLKAGGLYYNVGTTSISGLTKVSNANCGWQNDGQYTSGSFEVDQYSVKNYNNCKLTVTDNFWLNRGKFVLNGGIDGGASLICNTFTFEDTSNFYMGGKSLVLVNGVLTTNNCNSSYGFRATSTTDYAVLKARSIVKGIDDDQFHMSYYGKLYVDAGSHFAQGYKDTGFGEPYYFFDNDVKFSFAGAGVTDQSGNVHGDHPAAATIPVSIPVSSCTPGYNTTTTTTEIVLKQSGRVFCEDLGNVGSSDIDYNDVVFDAWIYVKRTNNDPNTDVFHCAFIQLLAAGGTMSVQVAGEDVHPLFGVQNDVMVNTFREDQSNIGGAKHAEYGVNGYTTFPDKIVITNANIVTGLDGEMNIRNIPITVKTYNTAQELTAGDSEAPLKFMAPIGTKWAAERVRFGNAYERFSAWVSNPADEPWAYPNDFYTYDGSMPAVSTYAPTDAEIAAASASSSTGGNNGNNNGGGSGDGDAPSFGTLTGTEVAVNTTPLSSNSSLTVGVSDISNTPAATIYVYGTGEGIVYVNGVEATTVATRAAAGVVKSCTLTPKQMGLGGLTITGGNFTVYRLSYQATTLPAVSQPAGTVLFGGNGQSKNMANWGINQFSVAGSSLSGLTDKTKIRVAGIGFEQGNDSWQVQIAVGNPWTVIGTQTYWTKGTDGAVTVEFELTQDQATALLSGGLIVQGINFIMKYVTVDNSGVSTDEPTYEGTILWQGDEVPSMNNSFGITPGPKITSATGKLRFYGTLTDTSDPKIIVNINQTTEILNSTFVEPYVETNVTETIKSMLDSWGTMFVNGQQYKIKAITWVQ